MHASEKGLMAEPSILIVKCLSLQPYIPLLNCWSKRKFKKFNTKIIFPESCEWKVIVYKFDVLRSANVRYYDHIQAHFNSCVGGWSQMQKTHVNICLGWKRATRSKRAHSSCHAKTRGTQNTLHLKTNLQRTLHSRGWNVFGAKLRMASVLSSSIHCCTPASSSAALAVEPTDIDVSTSRPIMCHDAYLWNQNTTQNIPTAAPLLPSWK